MLRVILIFIFSVSSLYAQNLYDSNCLSFVQSNKLIKAKSDDDLISSKKRTERYFYWEKINKKYEDISNDPSLLAEAKRRYRYKDNRYQINNCKDGLQNCNAYKAYCIEEVATKGMSEEIHEWNDRVKNCMNPKYRELHPNFCDKDFKRSLLYLKNMANQLAKTNRNKSVEAVMFFNEAKDTFQKYYNDMDKLLTSINEEKAKEKADELHALKKSKVQNSLDICRDLIKADDNDIGSKMYIDNLLSNYSCPDMNAARDLNPEALSSLEKMMSDIDFKAQERNLYPEITSLAMNKSVKATAATYMKFFGEDLNLRDSSSKNKYVKNLCKDLDDDYCKNPALRASMYQALNELNEETLGNPVKKISTESLQEDTKNFNATLTSANSLCSNIKKKAEDIKKKHKCSPAIGQMDSYEKKSRIGMELVLDCQRIKNSKYRALKSLEESYQGQAQALYAKAASTISGHLLVTEDFRDKVDLPSRGWVKERCISGNGKAFNSVTNNDVNKGLKDFYRLNLKEISDISEQKEDPSNKKSIIKDYLKNNPTTIVDLLNKNPDEDYAKAICSFVREINSDDYVKVVFERAAIGVGVVAGVALSITGIGAPIGVPLLAAVGTATAVEAGIIIYDINDINYNKQNIAQAASTNQIDNNQAINKTLSAEDQIFSRKIDLALTLSFGTLDIATESFKSAKLFYKSADAIKAKKILGVTKAVTDESAKRISVEVASGFESFSYYAKKSKIKPELIKELSDAQKIELGAIYSKLNKSEQKLLTDLISKTDSQKELSTMINKISESSDLFMDKNILNFDSLYDVAKKEVSALPNSQSISSTFQKSDQLLYLNAKRVSKNTDIQKSEKFNNELSSWYNTDKLSPTKKLSKEIQDQLNRNKIPFTQSNNRYILSAKTLKEGEVYSSEIERFTKRMNDLGVQVVYDPAYLKRNKMQGAYSPGNNTVYLDNFSIVSNKISPISFHEGSHVWGIEKYIQGIDDDLNLFFTPAARSPSNKIFTPSEVLNKKYNGNIPYADGFWAQESKVFSNELRQNIWSKTPNLDAMRRNTETLNLINKNAIENSQRVLDHVSQLKTYISKDQAGMANLAISVEKELIKGKTVRSFNLTNFNVTIDPLTKTKSDIKTQIKVVTDYQKDLAQRYIKDRTNPKILEEILNEFDLKAIKYNEISKSNELINNKVMDKVNSIITKGTPLTRAEQKELIDLTAQLSKTTKTPTPKGLSFESRFKAKAPKKQTLESKVPNSKEADELIKVNNLTDAPSPSTSDILETEKFIKSTELKWRGGFAINNTSSYPSLSHVIKGNISTGPKGPILKGGMHTDHSLGILIRKNKAYSKEMLTPEGKIKSKYYRQYPNGVKEIRIPQLDKAGEIIRGPNGVKSIVKNLFPNDWTRADILDAAKHIKKNTTPQSYVQSNKGNVFVYEGEFKGVKTRAIINTDGEVITVYPANNTGAVRGESQETYLDLID